MEYYIQVDEHESIKGVMATNTEEIVTPDLIPITYFEYKFLRRYGVDVGFFKHARFANSIKKKIHKYLNGEDKDVT